MAKCMLKHIEKGDTQMSVSTFLHFTCRNHSIFHICHDCPWLGFGMAVCVSECGLEQSCANSLTKQKSAICMDLMLSA